MWGISQKNFTLEKFDLNIIYMVGKKRATREQTIGM